MPVPPAEAKRFYRIANGQIGARLMIDPKEDLELILNDVLPSAQNLLSKHGEFFPFAAGLQSDGKIVRVMAYDGRETPPSKDVIAMLIQQLRVAAEGGVYIATGLVYDVRIGAPRPGERDGVMVSLDHQLQLSADMLFPYQIRHGKAEFGEGRRYENTTPIFAKE